MNFIKQIKKDPYNKLKEKKNYKNKFETFIRKYKNIYLNLTLCEFDLYRKLVKI